MEARGLGWGPKGEYGTRPRAWLPWQLGLQGWEYYGEGRYFGLRDHGEDRSFRREPPDEDRYWGNLNHRQSIPHVGILDVEYSQYSDSQFLREFFETIYKQEKRQENLFSLRRNFADNMAATALYKYRLNDFESEVERLPEGKLQVLQQPLFQSGLYTDVVAQAANLRLRPAAGSGLSSTRYGRADVLNEWSYPIHHLTPYLELRPFGFLRYSAYEELVDPAAGSEDRAAFGAGMTLSQEWSRIFAFDEGSLLQRWLGVDQVRHLVVPKVTYFNLFANDLDPEDTFGIDEVDTVDLRESFAISLRQALFTRHRSSDISEVEPILSDRDLKLKRAEYETRSILDSEISFAFFPRPHRDNEGDRLSELILDNTFRPYPGLGLRAWVALDPNEHFRAERVAAALMVDWLPGVLSTSVGDRLTRGRGGADDTNFVYGLMTVYLGEKWRAQAYLSRDVAGGRDVEYSFALARVFHRFALTLEYSIDVGEGRNHSVSVNVSPLDLVGGMRSGGQRRW
jgi:hypothetical protein